MKHEDTHRRIDAVVRDRHGLRRRSDEIHILVRPEQLARAREIRFRQIQRDRFELRPCRFHEREKSAGPGANIEQQRRPGLPLLQMSRDRNIGAAAHRIRSAGKQRLDLKIIQSGRMFA